jgi:hypothetical protein
MAISIGQAMDKEPPVSLIRRIWSFVALVKWI